jgi:hypothetical protein
VLALNSIAAGRLFAGVTGTVPQNRDSVGRPRDASSRGRAPRTSIIYVGGVRGTENGT